VDPRVFPITGGIVLTVASQLAAQIKKEATAVDKADPVAVAAARAVAYLRKQVDAAKPNGDVIRALVIAGAKGHDVGTSLDGVMPFLKSPSKWPAAERVALGHALAAAERHGRAASTDLDAAAKLLIGDQQQDGSYGSVLDSWRARHTMIESGMQPDEVWIIMIDRWVRGISQLDTTQEVAATLLALDLASDVMAEGLRRSALSYLRGAQGKDGGWGPKGGDKPAIVDTALAILALSVLDAEPRLARSTYRPEEIKDAIARGKAYLASQQRADGSWAERDATPWALLAMI
jgi:hypothetical protein